MLSFSGEFEVEDIIAGCVERQLADPIPIPSWSAKPSNVRPATPRPLSPLQPTFDREYSELGRGNCPIQRDDLVRSNHQINRCKNLVPGVDASLSPPMKNRWPSFTEEILGSTQGTTATTLQTIYNRFNGLSLSEETPMTNCSGYNVYGKSVTQIQSEAAEELFNKTVTVGK